MRTVTGSWFRFAFCSVALSASLAACGGGGGSDGSTSAQSSSPPPTTPAPGTPASPGGTNSAPTIGGTAQATVAAGQAYSFTPTASDADQDTVTFTIANKPSWATFNAGTGLLSGTPAASDVGAYSGIEIAATDGKSVTALPAFSVTVSAATASTRSVSIAWTPPTQNEDGSALTDLSGYKIHYGATSRAYTGSVAVDSAGLTRYELDSLPTGTIYIAMTSVNAAGAESDYSAEITVN
jgi:hypothetical protein